MLHRAMISGAVLAASAFLRAWCRFVLPERVCGPLALRLSLETGSCVLLPVLLAGAGLGLARPLALRLVIHDPGCGAILDPGAS